ncbi:MAG: GNAT family N-acetyltransferase, partial [Planctomycetes bacterium]|nr:GNAT family N-acetyltransferase [Planctomycetota bacterium]
MIVYRKFRNSDPPHLLRLWNECGLGRGAACGVSCTDFDELVIAQPYFDPRGLIVAVENGIPVGFIHAGFSVNESQTGLLKSEGVICALMVHPQYRRQGIGRELLRLAEIYLKSAGSEKIFAGPSERRDPFYCGLYGGSQSAGFLESDRLAAPFF